VIGSVNPVAGPHHNFTGAEPVGVVTLIGCEKFNLKNLVAMISAIIASGNTLVVLMPQEGAAILAPLAEVFMTSDLPKGVINLLSGDTQELYKVIGSHMEAQSICYLGTETKVLTELKSLATASMKRVVWNTKESWGLEPVLSFVEYKTVWHPIGY
ncbi:MAG: aldehyde dehydrogenase family protein, partial [Pseudomonadota bacterium]|nr:aldehyde dehydrogenase family protein [Pseudomonadota bacterium]